MTLSASSDAIGKTIFLNGLGFTVIGVAPASFTGPYPLILASLYVPMAMVPSLAGGAAPNPLEKRSDRAMFVHGRGDQPANGADLSQHQSHLHPGGGYGARVRGNALNLTLVVLIACANVMNPMLSRGS